MDNYFSDLTTASLDKALTALIEARQYAHNANAPDWLLKNLTRTSNSIQNRINDIIARRKPPGKVR